MRKGISIPINFIIVLALAVVTLAAVMIFFTSAQKGGGAGVDISHAQNFCQNKCVSDNLALSITVGTSDNCDLVASQSRFCTASYTISGETEACYDITTCSIKDNDGNVCVFDTDSCTSTTVCSTFNNMTTECNYASGCSCQAAGSYPCNDCV